MPNKIIVVYEDSSLRSLAQGSVTGVALRPVTYQAASAVPILCRRLGCGNTILDARSLLLLVRQTRSRESKSTGQPWPKSWEKMRWPRVRRVNSIWLAYHHLQLACSHTAPEYACNDSTNGTLERAHLSLSLHSLSIISLITRECLRWLLTFKLAVSLDPPSGRGIPRAMKVCLITVNVTSLNDASNSTRGVDK